MTAKHKTINYLNATSIILLILLIALGGAAAAMLVIRGEVLAWNVCSS
jgi:hypothetical protein